MCGIFGSPNFTPEVRRMLPHLAYAMQERGTHSWGASDGEHLIKHLGPIQNTWWQSQEELATWTEGIFHTRAASHGAHDKIENAHPFEGVSAEGTRYIGIHNGQLRNHFLLNTRYNRKCEVDSMHLWLHRAEGRPWTDFNGFAALAWWEVPPPPQEGEQVREKRLLLARINSPFLHIGITQDDGLVFCSTEDALKKCCAFAGTSFKRMYAVEPEKVYRAGPDGVLYDVHETVKFETQYVEAGNGLPPARLPQTPVGERTSFRGGGGGVVSSMTTGRRPLDGQCWKCNGVIHRDHILCTRCLRSYLDDLCDYVETEDGLPEKYSISQPPQTEDKLPEPTSDTLAELQCIAAAAGCCALTDDEVFGCGE